MAPLRLIESPGVLHIVDRGVGPGAVKDCAADARLFQQFLQRGGDSRVTQGAVRHQQNRVDSQPLQQGRQGLDVVKALRLPVGQQGNGQPERQLKGSAPNFYGRIHHGKSPSLSMSRRLAAMDSRAS